MAYSGRHNFKWTVNETLALQREHELLGWTVEEIAMKHRRTPTAITYRLNKLKDENLTDDLVHRLTEGWDASHESVVSEDSEDSEDSVKSSENIPYFETEKYLRHQVHKLNERVSKLEQELSSRTPHQSNSY